MRQFTDPPVPALTSARSGPRLAVRAVIVHRGRLLVVNAWPGQASDLWCVPGGGVERGASLHDSLHREVMEETGLQIAIGAPCLVNEFHDPATDFHQVEIHFRATLIGGAQVGTPADPAGVVDRRRWVSEATLPGLRFKPDSLPAIAFGPPGQAPLHDPLEPILR